MNNATEIQKCSKRDQTLQFLISKLQTPNPKGKTKVEHSFKSFGSKDLKFQAFTFGTCNINGIIYPISTIIIK